MMEWQGDLAQVSVTPLPDQASQQACLGLLPRVFGGIAQLVERQLCKLDVAGSNPAASTKWSRAIFDL